MRCPGISSGLTLCFFFFFFFQAEDGIRDADVTGVQTCALPILLGSRGQPVGALGLSSYRGRQAVPDELFDDGLLRAFMRSEERRVGKECRYRWWREA